MAKKAERLQLLPSGVLPFGVDRVKAAALIGVSESTFDKCVAAGTMPQPRILGGRNIWDVEELYQAFKRIPHREEFNSGFFNDGDMPSSNPWDDA